MASSMKRARNSGARAPRLNLACVALAAAMLAGSSGAWADAGVDRMEAIQQAVQTGDTRLLSPTDVQAVQAGTQGGVAAAANQDKIDPKLVSATEETSARFDQLVRQAYVSALPAKDQALGRSVLLGDGTVPGSPGKLYFFVSRAMPMSLLRAYAIQALYMGGTLVVKGVRKGDSIKDYVEDAMNDFNSSGGQVLAGMDIDPNLFDIFNVTMVPAVVWTNRANIEGVGAGCEHLPDDVPHPQITLDGPNDTQITVDRPMCLPAPDSSYFKITGALSMTYVLDRFEQAGAPREVMEEYRQELAEMAANGVSLEGDGTGISGMNGAGSGIQVHQLPHYMLRYWQRALETSKVQRSNMGPVFSSGGDDDTQYRQELTSEIEKGLGEGPADTSVDSPGDPAPQADSTAPQADASSQGADAAGAVANAPVPAASSPAASPTQAAGSDPEPARTFIPGSGS
jgi:type-F conjugative transfer system pilin assembly protein TrbC